MINTELTLDQLQTISGGGKEERQARRAERKAARAEKNSCVNGKRVQDLMALGLIWVTPMQTLALVPRLMISN